VYRRERKDSKGAKQVRWVVERRPGQGKPKSYRVFESRTEAEEYGRELRAAEAVAATPIEHSITVEDAWARYRTRAATTLRAGALETYAGSMKKHILPAIGEVPVAQLDSKRVRKLVDDLISAGLRPQTVRNAIGALRSSLAWLVEDGILPSNPASIQRGWLPTQSQQQAEPRSLTQMQLREFLTASKGEPYETLILFLALTGCRIGEAMALRWPEVDLERKMARIVRSVRLKKEAAPKTRFGRRSVDMPTILVKALSELPTREKQGLVFTGGGGDYVSARHLHHVFRRVSRRAGLPPVHPHMLRHTWATLMINRGVPLNYVSRALGHHSTAFTAGVYATAHPDSRHEDVDRLASLAVLQEPEPEA
jgi:integrase